MAARSVNLLERRSAAERGMRLCGGTLNADLRWNAERGSAADLRWTADLRWNAEREVERGTRNADLRRNAERNTNGEKNSETPSEQPKWTHSMRLVAQQPANKQPA